MSKEATPYTDKNGHVIFNGDTVKVDDDWDKYGWAAGLTGEVIQSPSTGRWCVDTTCGRFTIDDLHAYYLTLTPSTTQP